MRIAVVDGYSTSRHLVQELGRRGVDCVHLRSLREPPAIYQRAFDAAAYSADLGHFEDLAEARRALSERSVDRVIAGTESGVVLADTLSHQLGLPGNRFDTVQARRDKFEMADCLRAAGVDAPAGQVVGSRAEAIAWFEAHGRRPAVVKPVASAGTDGVRVCRTADEVAAACENVLGAADFFGTPNVGVLVQEFLDGTEYTVNTVTVEGRHKVAEIWRSIKCQGPLGAPLYDFQEPVPRGDRQGEEIISYVGRVLTALGIANGAGHSEVMLTPRGPVLIETGARLTGGVLPWVAQEYSGTSHISLFTSALCDPAAFHDFRDPDVNWSRRVRKVSLINHYSGMSQGSSWQELLTSVKTVVGLVSRISPGAPVPETVDLSSAPGFVYLAAESEAEIEADYARIRALEETPLYLA